MNCDLLKFFLSLLLIHSLEGLEESDTYDDDEEGLVRRPRERTPGEQFEMDQEDFGPLKAKAKFQKITCGSTYYMQDNGYMKIRLNKPKEDCNIGFLGSRASGCTVEIMCRDVETTNPAVKSPACYSQFLELSDGLGGNVRKCGKVTFPQPYRALFHGKDIFLRFKGTNKKGFCEIYCSEDKKSGFDNYEHVKNLVAKALPKYPKDIKYTEKSCVCGIKNEQSGRIVGGDDAIPFEYPWLSPIVFSIQAPEQNISKRSGFCGASLINDRHLISAAHCFYNTELMPGDVNILLHSHVLDLFVTGGSSGDDLKELLKNIPGLNLDPVTDEDEGSIRVELKDVKVHPLYNPDTFDFDIAILYLKKRLNLKNPGPDSVLPICLPPEHLDMKFESETCEVAGWGTVMEEGEAGARVLQKVEIPIIPWANCSQLVDDLLPRHICGYAGGTQDSCQGDSGGPMMCKMNDKQYVQAGVVSSGIGCAREEVPGLYVNIPEVIQWIYFNTRRARWCRDS